MVNAFRAEFDEPRDLEGFRAQQAPIGHQLGTQRLGASVWDVPPGEAAYPYHAHLGEEELVVVLAGRPSLRTPTGWHELEQGEVVSFLRGEEGAHQIVNRTDATVLFLAISTNGDADLVLYPDSGKVGVFEHGPGTHGGFRSFFRIADGVDFHVGEPPPPPEPSEIS